MRRVKYNPYLIFKNKENNYFLYLIHNNAIYAIDEQILMMLSQSEKLYEDAQMALADFIANEEFEKLYQNMQDVQLIYADKIESVEEKQNYETKADLRGITLMVIQQCNLRCTYCYGDGGEYHDKGKMASQVAKRAIDFLICNSTRKELLVCFLGGEPMMNWELIKEVTDYCELQQKETGRVFRYTITTNGTIWNKEIEEFFKNKKFTVQISVDGTKEVHNCNRFYASGVGSFDVMEENTREMRNEGLVSGRATITRTNINILENFKALDELNFKSIPMVSAQNLLSEEDYEKLILENNRLAHYFLRLVQDREYKTAKKMRIFMSGLYKIHKSGHIRDIPCGVGTTQIAIDINGDIYPCHRFVANKEYSLGNVLTSVELDNTNFIEEISIKYHEECKKCWAKNLCAGACPNENLVNTGTTQNSTKKNCKYIKAMYKSLINIYINLSLEDKKELFS